MKKPHDPKQLLEDFTRLAGNAMGVVAGMRAEIEAAVRNQIEHFAKNANLVTREEFEVVRKMATKAREENAALEKRLKALEKKK